MKKILVIISLISLTSCKSQNNNVKIIIYRDNKIKSTYYFEGKKLKAITLLYTKDSTSFTYKDTLLVKIEQYDLGRLKGQANFYYDKNNNEIDRVYSEDYENNYERYFIKTPFINRYKLLEKDFVYIDAILEKSKEKNTIYLNKKTTGSFEFKLDVETGSGDSSKISPFIFGTNIKKLKLKVIDNFLKEMDAVFIDNPSGKLIHYKKYYTYDNQGRLNSTKTIDAISGKIETKEMIKYSTWK